MPAISKITAREQTTAMGRIAARRIETVRIQKNLMLSAVPTLSDHGVSLAFISGRNPIILAGWTLEFEMFFYGSAALATLLGSRWSLAAYVLIAFAVGGKQYRLSHRKPLPSESSSYMANGS